MNKIDVCVNVYGKPWQTLVTLKSLLKVSYEYIDKIYFIEETRQPYGDNVEWVVNELGYENTVYFKPKNHLWVNGTSVNYYLTNEDYRQSLRYQYGIEKTDKKYLLLIHNDVLFNSDIIKTFLENIGDGFGIGNIGQCWNCPLNMDGLCNSEKFSTVKLSYEEVINSVNRHPDTRTFVQGECRQTILNGDYWPMPECRINEWCCMLDIDKYKKNVIPNGSAMPFGGYFKLDLADSWFEDMYKLGYKPVNYDIYKHINHAYFSNNGNGHSALFDIERYKFEEELGKKYYIENLV